MAICSDLAQCFKLLAAVCERDGTKCKVKMSGFKNTFFLLTFPGRYDRQQKEERAEEKEQGQ